MGKDCLTGLAVSFQELNPEERGLRVTQRQDWMGAAPVRRERILCVCVCV